MQDVADAVTSHDIPDKSVDAILKKLHFQVFKSVEKQQQIKIFKSICMGGN